jgi:hypothetical protein
VKHSPTDDSENVQNKEQISSMSQKITTERYLQYIKSDAHTTSTVTADSHKQMLFSDATEQYQI